MLAGGVGFLGKPCGCDGGREWGGQRTGKLCAGARSRGCASSSGGGGRGGTVAVGVRGTDVGVPAGAVAAVAAGMVSAGPPSPARAGVSPLLATRTTAKAPAPSRAAARTANERALTPRGRPVMRRALRIVSTEGMLGIGYRGRQNRVTAQKRWFFFA